MQLMREQHDAKKLLMREQHEAKTLQHEAKKLLMREQHEAKMGRIREQHVTDMQLKRRSQADMSWQLVSILGVIGGLLGSALLSTLLNPPDVSCISWN